MLSNHLFRDLKRHARNVVCTRNLGIVAPAMQKATDSIQQLFVDKLREYKSKSAGGTKLVEPSPEIERELKSEIEKVTKAYGGDKTDLTHFPTFKFTDPAIDSTKHD